MEKTLVVCCLQGAAGLGTDLNHPLWTERLMILIDEIVQRLARQQRHDEEWPGDTIIVILSHIEDFDDIGVNHSRKYATLPVKQVKNVRAGYVAECLDRDLAAHDSVIRSIHHPHSAVADAFAELVTILDCGWSHRSCGLPLICTA